MASATVSRAGADPTVSCPELSARISATVMGLSSRTRASVAVTPTGWALTVLLVSLHVQLNHWNTNLYYLLFICAWFARSLSEVCSVDCGTHGVCMGGSCRCEEGWTGAACDQRVCNPLCVKHGTCKDGKCECEPGWNGEHCTIGKQSPRVDQALIFIHPPLHHMHGRCACSASNALINV